MSGEQGALGAGEVVLGEVGDLLEEVGAALVVEEPGGEGLRRGGEAGEGFVEDGLVKGDGGGGGHGASRGLQGTNDTASGLDAGWGTIGFRIWWEISFWPLAWPA